MAIITPSANISEIRGSVGAQTFSRNRYRAYVKAKVSPVQPDSATQILARDLMANASTDWRLLSEETRLLWIVYANEKNTRARLGEDKPLTGFNLWCRHYIWFNRGMLDNQDVPIPEREQPYVEGLSFFQNVTDLLIFYDVHGGTDPFTFQIFASTLVSPGITSPNSVVFREIKIGFAINGSASQFVNAQWAAVYGMAINAIPGNKIYFKIRVVDQETGQFTWTYYPPFISV